MATPNLSLNELNGSDYVNVDVFNENFGKIDALGLDYVIEHGSSGVWKYQIWKSGKAECWANYTTPEEDYTSNFHGAYYPGHATTLPNFPFTFVTPPAVNISAIRYNKQQAGYSGIWDAFITDCSTTRARCIISSQTAEESVSVTVGLHCVGERAQ